MRGNSVTGSLAGALLRIDGAFWRLVHRTGDGRVGPALARFANNRLLGHVTTGPAKGHRR